MPEKDLSAKKLSMASTKQEMLEAYNTLLKQLQEKEKTELRPEEEIEKKKKKEVVEIADSLSSAGVAKAVSDLKLEMSKTLIQLSERLEEEVVKYRKVKEAVEVKERELEEIFGIQKASQSLAALLETQNRKRQEFENEDEIRRKDREKDEELYEAKLKERDAEEVRRRQREKEEYEYTFKREQLLNKNKSDDEKLKLEKELLAKKEAVEKQLAERERQLSEKEDKLIELQKKVDSFPKELDTAIQKAVKETTERLQAEARNKEEFLKKSFEGERGVLSVKIESLERLSKDQKEQITKLSQQLEKAYQQIEDIAVKTVGSTFEMKSLLSTHAAITEQLKKQGQPRVD